MLRPRGGIVVAPIACAVGLASLLVSGCKARGPATAGGASATTATAKPPAVEGQVQPYTYPAPVHGTFRDSDGNIPSFEAVDGLAYPSHDGSGTVVWVTAKPIASPIVSTSACPMSEARSLALLRDTPWAEVTLDAQGKSKYFAAGAPYGGSMREGDAGNPWSSGWTGNATDRAAGSVRHGRNGGFSFDLPRSTPANPQVSYGEAEHGLYVDAATPEPSPEAIAAVYARLHDAAVKKDLAGILAAQGFDAREIAAIRGLPGIEPDVAAFADRFLDPGTGLDPDVRAGDGHLGAEGVDSKGKKFYNYYYFNSCGDRLLLRAIAVNAR